MGSLKSASNKEQSVADSNENFTMFTHQKRLKEGKEILKNYKDLRIAILELYLQVKIRNDEEIEEYNEAQYKLEKVELDEKSGFELVEMIKQCIE